MAALRPGQIIAGKYRLLRVVRSGGVSVVYRGESLDGRRAVAIKVINVAQAKADLRRRIAREVAILTRMDHRHVVKCYDSGNLDEDRMYLALEWLEGEDLADYKGRQPLTLRQTIDLLVQVGDALEFAHGSGVIHRDIKPANIYLMNPQPGLRLDTRVIDFGIAKIPESNAALTRAGAILGTPSYMAPEQASQAMDVDGRADVFSLGVVAYELVSGVLPWTSNTDLARLARILIEEPVPLADVAPGVPEPIANLIEGMIDNDVSARIQTAAAASEIAQSCLDVLSPAELDTAYMKDPRLLSELVRAETLDVPPSSSSVGVPKEGPRRHSTPTRALDVRDGGLAPVAPSVRFRSVVHAGESDFRPDGEATNPGVLEEHDDTQELAAPERAAVDALDEPTEYHHASALRADPAPSEEASEYEQTDSPWNSLSATAALSAMSSEELPAAPLSALSDVGFGSLLSYVDHTPTAMLYGRVIGLERLERRVTQPLGLSQPTLTLVIGPAGIGKTRVRTELAKLVRARAKPPRVFAGRAEESFRTTPYAFLKRMLFTEARVRSDDDDEVRRNKVLQMVPPLEAVRRILGDLEVGDEGDLLLGPSSDSQTAFMSPELMREVGAQDEAEEDRAVIAAFLCESLRVPYPDIPPVIAARHDPRLLGQQMRRALDVVLRALAEEAGLVILVDDAHLLDRQSAEILRDLTDDRHRVPVAVVAFALPTLLDADTREGSALVSEPSRPRETVQLGPLEPRASREMARSLVRGPVQADALELLVQRAAGNPLYLEQLVRAVQANGVLAVSKDGEYMLSGLVGDDDDLDRIPPTVAASVSARLSLLKPNLQQILTAAAIFGEVFWAEGVAELMDRTLEEVMQDLDGLLMAHFVRRRSVSRYEGETELEFTHAVVRSVALSRLKRKRRADFEHRAADYLERVGETDRALIARHVAQAGLRSRAAELYAEAAQRALGLGDTGSAGILAEEGLRAAEGVGRTDARIRLNGILEQVALAHGDWIGGREVMDTLADLLEDDETQAGLLLRRSRLASMARRYEEARVEAHEAERAFAALGDREQVARAQLYFAEASEALGDGRGALRGYLSAQGGLVESGASDELARSGRGLARISVSSGDYGSAENRFRSALVASRAVRDYSGIFLAELGRAEVKRAMGDATEARALLDEALRVAFDRGQRLTVRVAQVSLLMEEERMDDAFARLDRLYRAADGAGQRAVCRYAAIGQGQTFRRRPGSEAMLRERVVELEETSARLSRALEEAVTDDPSLLTALQLAAAIVEALRGAPERASELAETAQARFQAEGALAADEPPAVFYTVALVELLNGGPSSRVQRWLEKAVAQVDSIGSRFDRKKRIRYLQRPLCRAVLEEAERAGVEIARDVLSNRISAASSRDKS